MIISALIEADISMKRIQIYLNTNELMNDCITKTNNHNDNLSVSVSKGSYFWKRTGESDN